MPIQSDLIEPFPSGIAILEFIIIDILLLISFFIIIIKRKNIFAGNYDVLELKTDNKIRGLLAVLIVLHHLSLNILYAFMAIGIPYIYFSADNLEKSGAQETEKLGMIMHTDQDDLTVINSSFGNRARDTLSIYSELLENMLANQ